MHPPWRARRARTHRFLGRAGRGRWWPCGTPGDTPAAADRGGHGPACSPRSSACLGPRPAPGGRRRPGRSAPQLVLGAVTTPAAAPPSPPPPPQPGSLHPGKFGHRPAVPGAVEEKGRPAPPLLQRRRSNAPSSLLRLGGSGGIVTRGLPPLLGSGILTGHVPPSATAGRGPEGSG